MTQYICQHCQKSFQTQMALQGHSRLHGPSAGRISYPTMTHPETGKLIQQRHYEQYTKSLRECQHCFVKFRPTKNSSGLYCSRSCRATVVNKRRSFSPSVEERKLTNKHNRDCRRRLKYTSSFKERGVYSCICKHCGAKFETKRRSKYCEDHTTLYGRNNRNRYAFTFNIYDYPNMFDVNELKRVGFYSPKSNPLGFTRDHKISVNEAILNNYDPKYITHPLNCELMSFNLNNKKNTKSSMAYTDLVLAVECIVHY